MPGVGEMELKITANVNDAVSGITKVNTGLTKTAVETDKTTKSLFQLKEQLNQLKGGEGVFTETSLSKIKAYNAQIQQTEVEIKKLESAGVSGSNAVVKGFGDLYGAVRKLAYILPGVGIGAIFGLAINPLIDLISHLDIFNQKLSISEQLSKDLGEIQSKGAENSSEEIANLKTLYDATQNTTLSLKERKKAVDELQLLYPAYFKNISDEAILAGAAAKEYDKLTLAIIRKGIADAANETIKDIEKDLIPSLVKVAQAEQRINSIQQNGVLIQKTLQAQRLASGNLVNNAPAVIDGSQEAKDRAINGVKAIFADAYKVVQDGNERIKAIVDAVGATSLVDAIVDGNKKDKTKKLQTIADILKAMELQINILNTKELFRNTDETKGKIEAIEKAIDDLQRKFGLTSTSPLIIQLETRLNNIKVEDDLKILRDKLSAEVKRDPLVLELALDHPKGPEIPLFDSNVRKAFLKAFNEVDKGGDDLRKHIQQTLQKSLSGVFEDIGTSIGDALSGKGNVFENIFASVYKTLGAGIKQLGAYAIEYQVLKLSLNKLVTSLSPLAGIGVGIALEALGTTIENAATKIPGKADGGTNLAAGVYRVGERGPETVYLPRGTDVISNYKQSTGSIGGGMNMAINVDGEFILTGANLVASLNRQTARNSRNG